MELAAGLIVLALFAIVLRSVLSRLLAHTVVFGAGVVLYALLQGVLAFWPGLSVIQGISTLGLRLGLLLGGSFIVTLMMLAAVLPFAPETRGQFEQLTGIRMFPQWAYLTAWLAGSVMYHVIIIAPLRAISYHGFSISDWPLAVYCVTLVLALIIFQLRSLTRPQPRPTKSESAPQPPNPVREIQEDLLTEEAELRRRVSRLKLETEEAERKWAAAVLQERAARIQAERQAKEFAEARRKMAEAEANRVDQDLPSSLTVEEAYNVLSLAPGASPAATREAFRNLVVKYHPDKVSAMGSKIRHTAERETKRITMAYRTIKELESRKTPHTRQNGR